MNRRQIAAVLWAVILAAWVLPASAAEAPAVRIAILTGEGDRAVAEPAAAQLEAALTADKNVTLLERAEVRKILAEQKLSAAGLAQPETAARVGQLLGVGAFVFLDRIPKTTPQLSRVQVMEAKTGITLAAGTCEEQSSTAAPADAMEIVRRGMAKLRVPPEARHYVALLDLRNEEPGRSLDGLAEALGMLLLTDLSQSPDVVTLNREDLERLTQERGLTALETEIKTSSTWLDGGLRRQGEDRIAVRLSLRSLAGGAARDVTLQLPRADLAAARLALAKAVAEALGARAGAVAAGDPRAEAALFAKAAREAGDNAAAIRAAEAGYALDRTDYTYDAVYDAWLGRKYSLGDFAKLDDAGKRQALRATLRAATLAYEQMQVVAARPEKDGRPWTLPIDQNAMRRIPDMLLPADLTELQDELFDLERKARDFQLDYYRKNYGKLNMAHFYWAVWHGESCRIQLQDAGRDDLNIRRIRDLINAFSNPPGPTPEASPEVRMRTNMAALWSVAAQMHMLQPPWPRAKDAKAREACAALWHEYQRHKDPYVRMIACAALICMGEQAPENARRLVAVFLEELPAGHPYRTDDADYIDFPIMLDWALPQLDAAAQDDARRRVLAPWIEQRNGLRLIFWARVVRQSLQRLESLNRIEEANAFAGQIADIVSSGDYRAQNRQGEADQVIADLRKKRQEYAVKSGRSAPEKDAWARYDVRSVALRVKGFIEASVLDGDNLICLTAGEALKGQGCAFQFSSHRWSDGVLLHEAEPVNAVLPKGEMGWLVGGIAFLGRRVYAGTPVGLLEYVPGGRARLIGEADGLSGTEVGAAACYDGKLYLGYGSAFAGGKTGFGWYDPEKSAGALLASSMATEKHCPLDGAHCSVDVILPDPKRKCLWLSLVNADALDGLWRYTPATGAFQHVIKGGRNYLTSTLSWNGAQMLYNPDWCNLVLVDPDTLAQRWLLCRGDPKKASPPQGVTGLPLIQLILPGSFTCGKCPPYYDGEGVFLCGTYDLQLCAPDRPPRAGKEMGYLAGLHPSPQGIIAAGVNGRVWIIRKKDQAPVAGAAEDQPTGKQPKEWTLDCGNGASLKLALIPAGEFMMGSPANEARREATEGPQHRVRITKPFFMGICTVTQAQYEAVAGKNPAYFKGAGNLPVEQVSWHDAQEFCKKLSAKTGQTVRLPTEAEWEYACRAGTTTPFNTGETISTDQANYVGDSNRQKTTAVGSFAANAFGLYDMHGNVLQWCQDWYGPYPAGEGIDPPGPVTGQAHVLRGGSWGFLPESCRSASRLPGVLGDASINVGFRVVCQPSP